jgi:eukaryotic-like serine/threonine-protein kinase
MALTTRMWGAGKLLLLGGALLLTYLLFAAAAMRLALKTRDVSVPQLAGRTVNEASALLADAGLALKVEEGTRIDPKVPAGQILAQEPQAGVSTRRQRSVKVWLSAGPRSLTVPALLGESERSAELRVKQNGLELQPGAEIRSAEYPAGSVVAQSPSARSLSARVALLVNRGERGTSYVMPDLIGVNGDRAGEILRGHGFRVAVVASNPYPGVAAGIVLRQSPQGGFRIAPGEPISLEVSR